MTSKNFDLVIRSAIVKGEKPTKGLDAVPAPNPNQMNRLFGYLTDGTKVAVAQRHGKGGMDFNKMLNGKVFAVAADGWSPVFEKDKEGKPTKTQKQEDGLPLYSSSGFYLLSSKEYPALDLQEGYTHLLGKGAQVLLLTPAQLAARQKLTLTSEFDLELLQASFIDALADSHNLACCHDEAINKKRKRGIERAKEEAEDAGEEFKGAAFKELTVSKKDGNPYLEYAWTTASGEKGTGRILREAEGADEEDRPVVQYFSAEEAVAAFAASAAYRQLEKLLEEGQEVTFAFAQGHLMRTSVSFKKKAENAITAGTAKPVYGDAVYVHGAIAGWTKGLLAIMHSQHPAFPQSDYDAHHYVAAPRQAEIGMNKTSDGKWTPPQVVGADMPKLLLS